MSTLHEFRNSYGTVKELVGALSISYEYISGGRNSLYSDTREHSLADGKSFCELVMCKTHVKVSKKSDEYYTDFDAE